LNIEQSKRELNQEEFEGCGICGVSKQSRGNPNHNSRNVALRSLKVVEFEAILNLNESKRNLKVMEFVSNHFA
jgi:hypothetical protein